MHQSFETLGHLPLGDDRGILSSPLPGAKVNVELPRPRMTHTHICYRQA